MGACRYGVSLLVFNFISHSFAAKKKTAVLARERERHLTTTRSEQIPKYGQIRTESRLFRAPGLPSRHLTLHPFGINKRDEARQ